MGIFIGSIPNNTKEEVLLANDILKKRISVENSFNLLMEKFRKLFPQRDIFLFNRGRESLYFFLKQLNLKPSDEVLTQSFTCVAVSAPVLWCNSIPIYVDIEKDTFNMDISDLKNKINLKTRVIVVQHTFGNISDVKNIRDIVDRVNLEREEDRKIYIVEDCAHIFTNYYEKYDIGRYSDGFFFSFAQDKSISCTQGSLLVLNSLKIFENSKNNYSKIMEIDKERSEYNAKYVVLWNMIKKNYFRKIFSFSNITIGRILVIIYRKLGLIKKQASFNSLNDSNMFKLSNIQSKLLLEQLKHVEEFNEHRKEIVEIYDSGIREDIVFKHSSKSLLLRYPILVRNPNLIKEKLKEKGIIIGRWYTSPVFPLNDEEINTVGYKKGSCKNTEFCCKYIINLPTNIEVTKECARDIVDIVNNFAEHI